MKLSIEAKVAMAVATAFAALSFGAIAQEGTASARLSQDSLQRSEISLTIQDWNRENQLLAQQ
jgi:hypothetical protein